MTDRQRDRDAAVGDAAAAIIGSLGARLPQVSRSIQRRLATEIIELRNDPQILDLLGASVEGNVETVFDAVQYDIPIDRVEPPTAALEYARRLAQRGVPANALVRAYRLGQQALLGTILDAIRRADLDPGLRLDVYDRIATVTFRYIDWISQQVVQIYEAERDHWLENRSSVRAVRVHEVLEAADIDVDAVTAAIGYPLRRTHLALVLWFDDAEGSPTELGRLERTVRHLAQSIDAPGNALFVAADRMTGWGWVSLRPDDVESAVAALRRTVAELPDPPYIAIGAPLPGVDGFRRSHRQAQNARNVALAAEGLTRRITTADEPGLGAAALLGENLPEARRWVHETLGPLAADTENDARLRETLRTFLGHGSSYKSAAEELHLHFNSVKYRVQRAIERRGRPIADDRLDVEIALLVCHWFGAVVLAPND
ncbi:CdaR family transcriptional regulator [Rhodococcus sp. JVH1]|uniref:PucR family transcriptional regulator n=1 Tax=Rhodococcus sp. JVH1 TaxID=745408 RepID=UPI0005C1C740|nr:helix-turn-helix domain-containing protein [Rhodococcus sp. JVH1]